MTADSRYAALPNRVYTAPDGRQIVYKARRFSPRPAKIPLRGQITVAQGDRPDLVAVRALGRSDLFWRLADANNVLSPFELTAVPGRRLDVPTAWLVGTSTALES